MTESEMFNVVRIMESQYVKRIGFVPMGVNAFMMVGPPGTLAKLQEYIEKLEPKPQVGEDPEEKT